MINLGLYCTQEISYNFVFSIKISFYWNMEMVHILLMCTIMFNELRLKVIVCFVDIGGIADHHLFKLSFHNKSEKYIQH
jgi:hypothetical protein